MQQLAPSMDFATGSQNGRFSSNLNSKTMMQQLALRMVVFSQVLITQNYDFTAGSQNGRLALRMVVV